MIRFTWALIAAAAGLLAAAGARAGTIVDAAFVAEAAKRGAILWDVRSVPEYRKGHIPGAVTIGDAGSVLRDPNTEDFIARDKIEKILGEAGIDLTKEIVVYGNRGSASANFGRYALQYFGAKKTHVFHDGVEGWRAAGQPLSTEDHRLAPVKVTLAPNTAVSLTTQEMIAKLNSPNVQVVDARTIKEYLGEDVRAIRGGHIPGAINIPYEQNWKDPDTPDKLARRQVADTAGMSLKSRDELKQLYSRLDPNKETVVYCQSGVRAAQTAQVLEDLGFNKVRVFDSSWLGYAAKLDAPADNETYFNVGAMNSRMTALMRRVEDLERQLVEVRAAGAGQSGAVRCSAGQC
jgi:thiosulfate/3-mercaptopyruvate sulfurtransferase